MAKGFKPTNKMLGLGLLIVGVGLAVWGYRLSGGLSSQLTEAFSGSPPDKVMAMYVGGAVSAALGVFLLRK